jgi:hypothetical protein
VKQSINTDVKTFLLKKYESLLETKIHKMTIEKTALNPDAPINPELERSFGADPSPRPIPETSNFTTITKMDVQYTEPALITLKVTPTHSPPITPSPDQIPMAIHPPMLLSPDNQGLDLICRGQQPASLPQNQHRDVAQKL